MHEILTGTVTAFSGNGRKLGYPTANVRTETALKDGVYFGYADLGTYRNHPALVFIGTPTTIGDTVRRIEAHLLDATDRDYYLLQLTLRIKYFHRSNRTLASVQELLAMIQDDEAVAREWFAGQSDSDKSKV